MNGGVFYFYNAGNIFIANSIFINNIAFKGGAIYFDYEGEKNKGYN